MTNVCPVTCNGRETTLSLSATCSVQPLAVPSYFVTGSDTLSHLSHRKCNNAFLLQAGLMGSVLTCALGLTIDDRLAYASPYITEDEKLLLLNDAWRGREERREGSGQGGRATRQHFCFFMAITRLLTRKQHEVVGRRTRLEADIRYTCPKSWEGV
ncbi:hypothetical protein C0Q70_10848 [Pomacea canaliculata]|uniref:Uncharacterized protein n=1 Tax=Pomacea canaliculata TaxID=400727 RepID=A0A2T7P4C1_POMCA|nr:hypothetical protein C0Q70_10848 [Pomacea canaliculata]